jgi:MSHA biogenesis protein MshK
MTRALFVVCTVMAAGIAYAAPFTDPMRPPRTADAERGAASAGPRLESVLIAPDRRVAVISGQQVTIGSRIGDGYVIRITESEVLIRRPDGEEALKLFAGEAKRPSAPAKGK